MASALVFVFLLDNLPGFNEILNKTLQDVKFQTPTALNLSSTIEPCNTNAIQAILKSLHRASDLESILKRTDQIEHNDSSQEWSAETLFNFETILDVSLTKSDNNSKEIQENYIDSNLKTVEHNDCIDDVIKSSAINNITNGFPKSAPFLVAIFESLSNVTAQTCAGTLMSPHWVLTAASCVDFLGNFYKKVTSNSIYTIIVNATDSLKDGIAYNVTNVLLHPEYTHSRHKRLTPMLVPIANEKAHFALMRVEPGVEGAKDMVVDDLGVGGDVRVYGWMLEKNVTGNNSMYATSMPVRTIPCEDELRHVLCLSTNDTAKYNKLSSGGPVLTIHNNEVRLLAVAQTYEHSVGYPLFKHYKWIQKVLKSK